MSLSARIQHCSGSDEQSLPEGADQQRPPPTTDPARRQQQRLAAGFSKSCVLQRSKAGLRSWEYSDPSPGRGCPTTTPTWNPCSARPNTGLTTQAGHSRARRPSANGCPHLWTGTTTGTVTAGASSSLLGSAQWPSHGHLSPPGSRRRTGTQRHPRRWSRSMRCWHQPEVVWINPPPPEIEINSVMLRMAA